MPYSTYYKKGDWNVECDRCGYNFKASQCRKTWDNLFVCKSCWEPRHPQDFVKSKKDKQRVAVPRPPQTNQFNDTGAELTANSDFASGQAGWTIGASDDLTFSSSTCIWACDSYNFIKQASKLSASTSYQVQIDFTSYTSGSMRVYYDTDKYFTRLLNGPCTYNLVIITGSSYTDIQISSDDLKATMNSVSYKEIT